MGQHKINPTAIAAANGELPPKPKRIGKAEAKRRIEQQMYNKLAEVAPKTAGVMAALSESPYRYI